MFSALKLVMAGAIVALFGGFLLAGVLTTQEEREALPATVTDSPGPEVTTAPKDSTEPSDSAVRTDILPGVTLTVEEVEPGVFRVVSDGVSEFAFPVDWNYPYDIVAGHDGGIYVLEPGHYARLGQGGGSAMGHKGFDWGIGDGFPSDVAVAPDGILWATFEDAAGGHIYSTPWGSGVETRHLPTPDGPGPVEVTSDGTVWAVWLDDSGNRVFGYLGADGWTMVGEWPCRPVWGEGSDCIDGILRVSDRGEVWALFIGGVARFDGETWREEEIRVSRDDWTAIPVGDVGVDGTFWGFRRDGFARFDGTEWTTFEPPDWMPTGVSAWGLVNDEWVPGLPAGSDLWAESSLWGEPHVAPDGSLWVPTRLGILERDPDLGGGDLPFCGPAIDGVASFDGERWSRFLRGRCVEEMDIAADGSVWLLATRSDARYPIAHVYVITPEAVTAAE